MASDADRHTREHDGALAESPALTFAIFIVGFAAGMSILAILDQMGFMRTALTRLLASLPVIVALIVAWPARARRLDDFLVDGRGVGSGLNAAAMAAVALSSTLFLGHAGAMLSAGYDALPVVTGMVGGFMLLTLLLAAHLRRSGAVTPVGFLGLRYGGGVRTLAALVVLAVAFLGLALQLSALALVGRIVTGVSWEMAVALAVIVTLASVLAGGMRAVTWIGAILVLIILASVLVPGGVLGWRAEHNPFGPLGYGSALREIADLELSLIAKRLADGASLKRHTVPYLTSDALNAAGIGLGLMAGIAAMPHILARALSARTPAVARSSSAWAMLLVLVVVASLPAFAAFGKLEIYRLIAKGAALADLPSWIMDSGRLGLVKVCGADAVSADAVTAACRTAPGSKGVLRVQDLAIDPGAFLLALPSIAGLPRFVPGLIASGIVAAALASAVALSVALAATFAHDLRRAGCADAETGGVAAARAVLALAVVAAGTVVASRLVDLASLASWIAPLAAATLFPALVLGVWWRRSNSLGAIAGMTAGGGVVLYYLVATHYTPAAFFELWFGFSNAGMSAVMKYQSLKAALASAADADKPAALAAMEAQARLIANWWGLKPAAAGLVGMPVAFAVHVLVALLSPRPSPEVEAMIDDIRRPQPPAPAEAL